MMSDIYDLNVHSFLSTRFRVDVFGPQRNLILITFHVHISEGWR